MDKETRDATRERARTVWVRCPLPPVVRRVASRENRPLLANQDHAATLSRLMAQRYPIYAEADVIVDCGDEMPETTTSHVVDALAPYPPPRRLPVVLTGLRKKRVVGA